MQNTMSTYHRTGAERIGLFVFEILFQVEEGIEEYAHLSMARRVVAVRSAGQKSRSSPDRHFRADLASIESQQYHKG